MNRLLVITFVIIALYLLYRIGGKWLLPKWQEKRLQQYKERYFRDHPHISAEQYNQRKRQQEENAPIIDRKKRLR